MKTKAGKTISHWDALLDVKPNDLVVHYANGYLGHVSRVEASAVEAPFPEPGPSDNEGQMGRMVRTVYDELTPPIPLQAFARQVQALGIEHGPLDRDGGVKQGYLFNFSTTGLAVIQALHPQTPWPEFAVVPGSTITLLPRNAPYSLSECAADTGFAEETLNAWVRAVERKGQAVVYGPPGTGKTYVAERLARHLIGGGDGFSDLVQFHPAYAYEDFMQGIRPQTTAGGALSYPVVAGRFLDFCSRASTCQDRCVLIIDEINRANLARVFGELMYLLEYRDREVPLAAGGVLRVPRNVRIIGTMNTADRSIALVDHALRRRFAFLQLSPNFDVLRKFHQSRATGYPVERLIQVLDRLNKAIHDPHYEVGISFFLREGLAAEIEDIWRMEIEPYLDEYFFDQPDKADALRWSRVRADLEP